MTKRAPGLKQKKSLSQVFLKETWPCEKITEYLSGRGASRVLEIGPGGGVLTQFLVDQGFKLTVVEKDERFADLLRIKFPEIEVLCEDILNFDLQEWIGEKSNSTYLAGNLPYQISSPILYHVTPLLPKIGGCAFMFQKEFAERLLAKPNTSEYSHLSLMMQLQSKIESICLVPKSCFQPIPKVDSQIVSIESLPHSLSGFQIQRIDKLSKMAFSQRRKKLRNSISAVLGTFKGEITVDLELRAGVLSPKDYTKLAQLLYPQDF